MPSAGSLAAMSPRERADRLYDRIMRLHEEGMRLSGEIQVTPVDERQLRIRLQQAEDAARAVHWRLDALVARLAPPQ